MIKLTFTARFVTPAFLGSAEQQGRWRTPPFKALLRQCWRIAHSAAAGREVDVERMRAYETRLFGTAADTESASGRSLVRLRLDSWAPGNAVWPSSRDRQRLKIAHPANNNQVDPFVYLGYGPVDQSGTARQAVAPGQSAVFRLAILDDHSRFPADLRATLFHALGLMHEIGTLGGRNRNGYGSLGLEPNEETAGVLSSTGHAPQDDSLYRDWRTCLTRDWPHAIGRDESGPLIWQTTRSVDDWQKALQELARRRLDVNARLELKTGRVATPSERHLVAYPRGTIKSTPNAVTSWKEKSDKGLPGRDLRLPNSLRLKVVPDPDRKGHLLGRIVHVPCAPNGDFHGATRERLDAMWTKVHGVLDEDAGLRRLDRLGGLSSGSSREVSSR